MKFEEIKICLQEGDVITSKKGIIAKSPISDEWYLYKKARYEGKGIIVVIGNKEKINVRKINKEKEVNLDKKQIKQDE